MEIISKSYLSEFMFLYRAAYYNKDSESKGIIECIVAKNRNGEVGTVRLKWQPEVQRIRWGRKLSLIKYKDLSLICSVATKTVPVFVRGLTAYKDWR